MKCLAEVYVKPVVLTPAGKAELRRKAASNVMCSACMPVSWAYFDGSIWVGFWMEPNNYQMEVDSVK